jgi:hypothetical protein
MLRADGEMSTYFFVMCIFFAIFHKWTVPNHGDSRRESWRCPTASSAAWLIIFLEEKAERKSRTTGDQAQHESDHFCDFDQDDES